MKHFLSLFFSLFSLVSLAQTEVHVYLLEDCPMAQFYGPTFQKLQSDFPNVKWTFLFPNSNDSLAAQNYLQKHRLRSAATFLESASANVWKNDQPFGVSPSVVVWNQNKITYRGAIDDAFVKPGKRRTVFQNHYLQWVLEKSSSFQKKSIQPVGCLLSLPKNH